MNETECTTDNNKKIEKREEKGFSESLTRFYRRNLAHIVLAKRSTKLPCTIQTRPEVMEIPAVVSRSSAAIGLEPAGRGAVLDDEEPALRKNWGEVNAAASNHTQRRRLNPSEQ